MCSFIRRPYLTILVLCGFIRLNAQSERCDSLVWNFNVNQFAIDGDNLLADFAEKGWTPDFFQSNTIDVTIYGATDCPGSYAYNTKLAGNRALYLTNYFEVSAFPHLTIERSYAIPERNCVKPGQGYNRADRVTALKVCWSGAPETLVDASGETSETAREEVIKKDVPSQPTETERAVQPETESVKPLEKADSAQTTLPVIPEQPIAEEPAQDISAADSLAQQEQRTQSDIAPVSRDSIYLLPVDSSLYMLPVKAKKTLSAESTPEFHKGDELIAQGLNFYPGSHRTLPEAKPILKKILELLEENPNLKIEIQGHVCCASKPNEDGLDDETGDFKLSWNRAQYVRDYLVQNGIDADRITYRGFAMTRPLVYPEKTIQDQIKNRRVEILITSE